MMDSLGLFRVAACIPSVDLGNPLSNIEQIIKMTRQADANNCKLVLFPELSITGYTCGDLFNQQTLLESTLQALERLVDESVNFNCICIVGLPIIVGNYLFNCAAAIAG